MKNDARNAIAVEQTYFAENQAYQEANSANDGVNNGKIIGTNLSVSKGNTLVVSQKECGDGTIGFNLSVTNDQYSDEITFDSCEDGKIVHSEGNNAGGDVQPQ